MQVARWSVSMPTHTHTRTNLNLDLNKTEWMKGGLSICIDFPHVENITLFLNNLPVSIKCSWNFCYSRDIYVSHLYLGIVNTKLCTLFALTLEMANMFVFFSRQILKSHTLFPQLYLVEIKFYYVFITLFLISL